MKDSKYAIYPKTGRGGWHEKWTGYDSVERKYIEIRGIVHTPQGLVEAYSMWFEKTNKNKSFKHSWVSMIIDGTEYSRGFDRNYSWRGLVTKAKKFAIEISEENK